MKSEGLSHLIGETVKRLEPNHTWPPKPMTNLAFELILRYKMYAVEIEAWDALNKCPCILECKRTIDEEIEITFRIVF